MYDGSNSNKAARKALGLCTNCGRKAEQGNVLCRRCAILNSERGRRYYERRKASGKCWFCQKPAAPGRISCPECAEKRRKENLKRKGKGMKRYDRLKAEGICAQCGQEWARPGKTRCEKCATWTREYYKRKRDERMSRGLCLDCGKAVKHGDLRCPECRRKVNEVSLRCYHARMARMKGLNDGGGAQ